MDQSFLTGRKQRVRVNYNSYSEFTIHNLCVPQGTKLGHWLFIIMINNLKIRDSNVWKFVGDSLGEIVNKNEESNIQTLTIYVR